MKNKATYVDAGWDFGSTPVWQIKASANNGYPCLTAFANCPAAHALTVRVTSSAPTSVYGDAIATFNWSIYDGNVLLNTSALTGLGLTIGGTASLNGKPAAGADAGAYQVAYGSGLALGGASADDFTLNAGSALNYAITKRSLNLAGSQQYTALSAFAAGTFTSSSLVTGDCTGGLAACGLTGSASVASKNVSAGAQSLQSSTLALTGALDMNYTLTGGTTTAVFTKRDVTAVVQATGLAYDGTTGVTATIQKNVLASAGDDFQLSATSVQFQNKNAGVNKTVLATGIIGSGTDAGSYRLLTTTASGEATITPLALGVTATAASRVYNGTANASATLALDIGVVAGDSVTVSGNASFADKHVGNGKTVTVSGITFSGADAQNYVTSQPTVTATADITPRALTALASGGTRAYDGTSGATVTLSSSDVLANDAVTFSSTNAAFADNNAGTSKTITVSGIAIAGAGNYTLQGTSTSILAAITPRQLAPTATATATNRTYDGTTGATATVALDNTGVVSGDQVTLNNGIAAFASKHAGTGKTVTISGLTLSGTDAANYTMIGGNVTATADITPRTLTVNATGASRAYDGTVNGGATLAAGTGYVSGDSVAVTGTATFGDKNVGTGKAVSVTGIGLAGTDAGNYTLQSTTASTTADITARIVNVEAIGVSRTYDDTINATAILFTGDVVAGETVVIGSNGSAFADKNARTGKTITVSGLTLSGADASNYVLASSSATTQANIAQRQLFALAAATDRVYDGSSAATVALTLGGNVVSGDQVGIAGGTASFADKNVGTAKTVTVSGLTLTGTDAINYTLALPNTSTEGTITARTLTVGATGINRVYNGGIDAAVTLTDNRAAGDVLAMTASPSAFADKNAGTAKAINVAGIAVSGTDAGNYVLAATTAATTATVTPRTLALDVTASDRVYDGITNADVRIALATGAVLEGDQVAISGGIGRFADKNVGTNKAVNVSRVSLSSADARNYVTGTTATSNATIKARVLHVTATGVDRVYNGVTDAGVTFGDNRVAGDSLFLSSASSTFADKNAGTGKAVAVSGIAMSGPDAGNYTLDATSARTQASITPRTLHVSATGTDREYDGSTAAMVAPADDRVAGDNLALSASASFADKNAGVAKIVNLTGLGMSGKDAGNYRLDSEAVYARASVTPRPLNVTATAAERTADGTTSADVTFRDDRVAGDRLSVSAGSAQFADAVAGKDKIVSITGNGLAGADTGNYRLASASTTALATILPGAFVDQPVTVTPVVPETPGAPEVTLPQLPVSVPNAPATSVETLAQTGTQWNVPTASTELDVDKAQAAASPVLAPASGKLTGSAAVTVSLQPSKSGASKGTIAVGVPKEMIANGEQFSFAMPGPVKEAMAKGTSVDVTRANGEALPAWLKFNADSNTFDVSAAPAGALPLDMKVVVDGQQ